MKVGADVDQLPACQKCHCDYSLERSRLTFKVICFMYDSPTTVITRRKHCTNGKSTDMSWSRHGLKLIGLGLELRCLI